LASGSPTITPSGPGSLVPRATTSSADAHVAAVRVGAAWAAEDVVRAAASAAATPAARSGREVTVRLAVDATRQAGGRRRTWTATPRAWYCLPVSRIRWSAAVLAPAALVLALLVLPAAAGARTPLRADGRLLRDARGRVVVLHGLFAVWKQPPYAPAGTDDPANPAAPSFTAGDADAVRALGADAVRLAWFWQGLEPTPGTYDSGYLERIAGVQAKLADRGVYTVLDSHQDQYDTLFGNKPGFPVWSAVYDGLALHPLDFPLGYFQPATDRAFGNLYASAPAAGRPLWQAYGDAWRVVARRFAGEPMVAGYDLVNEPFPGTRSATAPWDTTCGAAPGCPAFDAATLQPFETSAARAIRTVDRRRTVFYEPTIFFNQGVPNGFTAPPPDVAPAGLSFHDQCPTRAAFSVTHDPALIAQGHVTCPPIDASVLANAGATAARLGGPPLMTEVAATSDDDVQGLECLLERADDRQTGFTYGLSWSNPDDELRRLAAESAPGARAPFKRSVLARVYPRAIAGDPVDYGFDPRTGRGWLRYRPRAGVRGPTVIAVPALQEPSGYVATVTGGRVTSAPGSELLTVRAARGASLVTVTVTPVPGDTTARPSFPACAGLPSASPPVPAASAPEVAPSTAAAVRTGTAAARLTCAGSCIVEAELRRGRPAGGAGRLLARGTGGAPHGGAAAVGLRPTRAGRWTPVGPAVLTVTVRPPGGGPTTTLTRSLSLG
jgi:endoglycosylceramidase